MLPEDARVVSPESPVQVVFFGTPAYAAPTLVALAGDSRFRIECVVTQPDRQAGRGRTFVRPPVKMIAFDLRLPVYQPESLRSAAARAPLEELRPELFLVAAYGQIFGPKSLAIPQIGSINLHASLLPKYRGASPISSAILNGDQTTGVTVMSMDAGLDTGEIISMRILPIAFDETTESLTSKLADLAARAAIEIVPEYLRGAIVPTPQGHGASMTRPLSKEDGIIDWSQSALEIERFIRAMWPWPRAYSDSGHATIQVHSARVAGSSGSGDVGSLSNKLGIPTVQTGKGALELEIVQAPGGKPITGREWLRGAGSLVTRFPRNPSLDDRTPLVVRAED